MSLQLFTAIRFEVYNTTWVDITADVRSNPRPRWNRGIMSNKSWDRIGHPGFLTFTLDNSIGNLGGLLGYYSPGHPNCWAGWTSGLKVRLSFDYDGTTYYKYYGRIKPDGIQVSPGVYGTRTVDVTCGDWMYLAEQHELKTLTYETNKKAGDIVNAVHSNMPFTPLATDISTGVEIFPTIFDVSTSKSTAMSEYYKAAMSEWCYIYVKGGKEIYGSDLVIDGDLELWTTTNDLTNWTEGGATYATQEITNKYSGSYSVKLFDAGAAPYIFQTITLEAGKNYLISAWVKTDGVSASGVMIWDSIITALFMHETPINTTEYFQDVYVATGTEVYIALYGYVGGTAYIDALSVTSIADGEIVVCENQTTRTNASSSAVLSLPLAECGFVLKEDGDKLLKEDGDKLVWNDTQAAIFDGVMTDVDAGYGRTMANRINATAYPRRVDAAATTVLWALQKSFQVRNGEVINGYRGQYRDPSNPMMKISGISMAAMVSGTDFTATANEDGTGANLTTDLSVTPEFGSEAVYFQLTATADLWVQTLQVKGKGVYPDTPIQSVTEDAVSQATHGVIPISLDFKYQSDAGKVRSFSSYVIAKEAWPRTSIDSCPMWANMSSLMMMGFLELEPGIKAHFTESQTGIDADYFIMGYGAEIADGKYVLWSPVLKDDPGYYSFWILGSSELGIRTTLG